MRLIPLSIGLTTGTALIVGSLLTSFFATSAFAAPNEDFVTTSITSGSLSMTGFGASLSAVTLDGASDKTATGTSAEWTITDARGTGAEWTVSVSATDFVSAPGTVDLDARTLLVDNLTLTPGLVTPTAGSELAPTANTLTVTSTPQTLIATEGSAMGVYNLTPSYSLNVPTQTFRSNFAGVVGGSALHSYTSTITFTIL